MDASRLRQLLANSEDVLAAKCIAEMEAGGFDISVAFSMDASRLHRVYYHRWRCQLEVTKAEVAGYDRAVPALESLEGEVIVDDVVTEDAGYIMFSTPENLLVGVLRSPYANLEKLEQFRTEWRKRGW